MYFADCYALLFTYLIMLCLTYYIMSITYNLQLTSYLVNYIPDCYHSFCYWLVVLHCFFIVRSGILK